MHVELEIPREGRVADPKLTSALDSKYSVQALGLLAEVGYIELF